MKKSGVRFWALLLTAVMIVTGLPVLKARAEDPEPEQPAEIAEVRIQGLAKPREGKKPDYEVELAADSYSLNAEYGAAAISWMDKDAGKGLSETDVFEAGKHYTVYIRLKASDEESAVFMASTLAYVNGEAAQIDGQNKGTLNLHMDYVAAAAPSENAITSAAVRLHAPRAGYGPYTEVETASEHYESVSVLWIDRETGLSANDGYCVAGRVYGVQIVLKAKAPYLFLTDDQDKAVISASINGRQAALVKGDAYTVTIEMDFPPVEEPETGVETDGVSDRYTYTGEPIRPVPEVYDNGKRLIEGVDYTLKYSNNVKLSVKKNASLMITFKGNRSGKKRLSFEIRAAEMSDEAAAAGDYSNEAVYGTVRDGKRQELKPEIWHGNRKLKLNKDYTLEYPDTSEGAYVLPGSYKIRVVGKGNYTGSYELEEILVDPASTGMKDLAKAEAGVNSMPVYVPDDPKEVSVSFPGEDLLVEGKDYTVRYIGLGRVGTVSCIVTAIPGNGKCYGRTVVKYRIVKGNLSSMPADVLVVGIGDDTYVKGGVKPEVFVELSGVRLREGVDYKLSYGANNDASKKGTVKIIGKGAYSGSRTEEFSITPRNIEALTFCVGDADKKDGVKKLKYTLTDVNGKALKKNTDYTESITDHGDGSATLTLTAKGNNYYGTVTAKLWLRADTKDIKKTKVKLLNVDGVAYPEIKYSGKAICPAVELSTGGKNAQILRPGVDFEVLSYVTNIESGNAQIIIAGRGEYSGLAVYKFRIRPKRV